MEDSTNYTYSPTHTPAMESAPEIDPGSSVSRKVQQAQDWLTVPASSTIAQPSGPNVAYRAVRPKPPHRSTSSTLPPETKDEKDNQYQEPGSQTHSKHRRKQSNPKRVQTRATHRTVPGITGSTSMPGREGETRFATLYFRIRNL